MPQYSDLGAVGSVDLLKESGTAGSFTGQKSIGYASVSPTHPDNVLYPRMGNASQNLSVAFQGNYTPAVTLRTYFKPSVFTAALLQTLLLNVDATSKYTDVFAMRIKSQYKTRIFSKGRCAGIRLTQQPPPLNNPGAGPGPIIVDMGFLFKYGDHGGAPQDGAPPSFSAAAIDPGQLTNKSQVVWTGADQVKGFDLAMTRELAFVFNDDGTLNAQEIACGMFGGGLAVPQSSTNTTTPGSSATVAIGSSGAGVSIACALNRDNLYIPQDAGFVMATTGYTLADLAAGGIPVAITAIP